MGIYHARSGQGDWIVTGTGDEERDTLAINFAVKAINTAGRGRLLLEGRVRTRGGHVFTDVPAGLAGLGPKALVECTGTGNVFTWVRNGIPGVLPSVHPAIETEAGADCFKTNTEVPVGSVVVLYSEDKLPIGPHAGPLYGNYPGELHRVERWDKETGKAYVSGMIADRMVTNARMAVMPKLLEDVTVENLAFEQVGTGQGDFVYTLAFWGCNGLVVKDVHLRQQGAGAIGLMYCLNSTLRNFVIEGQWKADLVYGIVVAMVNGVLISDFVMTGTRHVLTTSSALTNPAWGQLHRFGTPLNLVLQNGVVNGPRLRAPAWRSDENYGRGYSGTVYVTHQGRLWRKTTATTGQEPGVVGWTAASEIRVPLDTHAEGYGVTFRNVEVNCEGGGYGGQTRSRKTRFEGCTFRGKPGTSVAIGLQVLGQDTEIVNCWFEDLWTGILVPVRHAVWERKFDYAAGAIVEWEDAVYQAAGNPVVGEEPGVGVNWKLLVTATEKLAWTKGLQVSGCVFRNVRGQAVRLEDGTEHMVERCRFEGCGGMDGNLPLYSKAAIGIRRGMGHRVLGNLIEKDEQGRAAIDVADLPVEAVKVAGNVFVGFKTGEVIGRLLDWLVPKHETNTFEHTKHGLVNGDRGYVWPLMNGVQPTGIALGALYYVVQAGQDSFKLAKEAGGLPVEFTDNGVYESATGSPVLAFRAVTEAMPEANLRSD